VKVQEYKDKMAAITPHLEAYAKLLDKKKKKESKQELVNKIFGPIIQWFKE
jgi:hypothetical protein